MRVHPLFAWLALGGAPLLSAAEQQFHTLKDLDLGGGRAAECRIGFRTYGELNADRSNAVLFPTWFNGRTADLESFIGPDKLLDPAGLFIITVDAPGNGVSCSPSNSPGAFPKLSIAGMVESQRRLLAERFGITHLHAVIGISMGGMQAFEWITAYPDRVRRAVPIVGSPRLTGSDLLLWNAQLRAIRAFEDAGQDPARAMPAVQTMHQFALETPARRARMSREETDQLLASAAAPGSRDPRDWAAQLEAMIGHDVARGGPLSAAAAKVRARTLIITAPDDQMVHPATAGEFARAGFFPTLSLPSGCGHRATACDAALLGEAVRRFLAPGP